jgi:hypothetical protein
VWISGIVFKRHDSNEILTFSYLEIKWERRMETRSKKEEKDKAGWSC